MKNSWRTKNSMFDRTELHGVKKSKHAPHRSFQRFFPACRSARIFLADVLSYVSQTLAVLYMMICTGWGESRMGGRGRGDGP